jgi:nicotinate phosphoribosyltransferase
LSDRLFWIAQEREIKSASTSDIYFSYAAQVLKKAKVDPEVTMEIYARHVPYPDPWGVVVGIHEVAKLLEGLPVDVDATEEGEIFLTSPDTPLYEPIMRLKARYAAIAEFENPILGLLCATSGVASKAARIRIAARDRTLLSFGTRRVHPALAPAVERAAYLCGFDGISNALAAKMLGLVPSGTMPHALIQCFGDQKAAWRAFDKHMDKGILRIALTDTFSDEKTESIMALETLGRRLHGVRLDTPASRRGDFSKIVQEVRWELNIRNGAHVKIYASGSIDESQISGLVDHVDGFGVGTAVSAAPVIDLNAKIVEVRSGGVAKLRAKRGDLGGAKSVYRREGTFEDIVVTGKVSPGRGWKPLLTPLIRRGRIVRKLPSTEIVRRNLMQKLARIAAVKMSLASPVLQHSSSSYGKYY